MTRGSVFEAIGNRPQAAASAWEDGDGPALHWSLSGRGATQLVLMHELGGSLRSFDALVPLLEADFRMLRFDQRGAGSSRKVQTAFTIADLADDMQTLAHATRFAAPFWILGAAAGAAVAIEFALRHPHQVAGLLLCAPALDSDSARRGYLEARAALAQRDGMQAVVDAALARSYPSECRHDEAVYLQYRQHLLACDPAGYALANRALAAMDALPQLRRIAAPCLLLAGRHDSLRPTATVHRYALALRRARCIEIDSGHLMAVQTPDRVAREIRRFVSNSGAPTHGPATP